MFIMLMFNDNTKYSVQEVADALQLDIETVRKNIASLSQPKYKILNLQKA